jgi:hypothetical protein
MAAKLPDSVVTENFGSKTLYICTFSTNDIDDADTYASGIIDAVAYWCNGTDTPTQGTEGIDVGYTATTGSFVFYTGEANRTGILYILVNQ